MTDRVRVYHPALDQFAVVAVKTLPIRQRKGWVLATDVETSSDPEESPTPPSGGDTEIPARERSNDS